MTRPSAIPKADPARQTFTGLTLFAALFSGWLALHVYGVFFHQLGWSTFFIAPFVVMAISWFSAGLFIVAHDAMHGSLAPGHPRVNAAIGGFILFIYAGFGWRKMKDAHMRHHVSPGSEDDPDFLATAPTKFLPWYGAFMKRYFGPLQFLVVASIVNIYYLLFGASYPNIVLFYGVPALLSSAQLFYFGTFLPHRHDEAGFADHHKARSNNYSYLVSLLTCFHFGYHHEHHLEPGAPWWRLPAVRRHLSRGAA